MLFCETSNLDDTSGLQSRRTTGRPSEVHEVIGASFILASTCEKFLDRNSAAFGGNNDFTHFDGIPDTWDVGGKR